MPPCSDVAAGGGWPWCGAAAWAPLMKIGNLRHSVIEIKQFMFMKVLIGFSISTQLVASGLPGLFGSGDVGAQYLILFPFVKTVSRAFFPYNFKDGTAEA